jgi:hypothetical protein
MNDQDIMVAICKMTMDRGFIINSFSQVECRLADLINQCSKIEEYKEIAEKPMPFGVSGRVARVRELVKFGPLALHSDVLEKLMRRFVEFEEVRHLLVHGYASFAYTVEGDMGMQFVRFVPPLKGAKFTQERKFYRLETIARQRESAARFVDEAMEALRRIFVDVGLDPDLLASLAWETAVEE